MAGILCRNPDGCTKFEPNAFKKEKCKHCGRQWTEHEGVISQSLLDGYLKAARKAVDDKQKAHEDSTQRVKAKQFSKKKAHQAVEDEWFFDGTHQDPSKDPDSDDDDMGFRMFTPGVEQKRQPSPEVSKPLKVVNLIDFGECDVVEESTPNADEEVSSALAAAASSSTISAAMTSPAGGGEETPAGGTLGTAAKRLSASGMECAPEGRHDLLAEIQHLKQLLADANEEKTIQVAIVRDEVAEKQQLVEDLMRQRTEAEAALKDVQEELSTRASELQPAEGQDSGSLPQSHQSEIERWRAEADRWRTEAEKNSVAVGEIEMLRAAVANMEKERDLAKAAAVTAEARAALAKAEAEKTQIAVAAGGSGGDRLSDKAAPQGELLSSHAEAHAVAQQMGRQATQALREIRQNAEQQLAWLSKRMLDSHLDLHTQTVM